MKNLLVLIIAILLLVILKMFISHKPLKIETKFFLNDETNSISHVYNFYKLDNKEIKHGTEMIYESNELSRDDTIKVNHYEHGKLINSDVSIYTRPLSSNSDE